MARVVVSGASGLVGKPLMEFLRQRGWEVQRLVRERPVPPDGVYWNIEAREVDAAALAGVEAVVHLAGESIAGLWTASKKRRIMCSRREGTRLLAETLAKLEPRPRVLVSASAVGYYGNGGDTLLTEDDGQGAGFLAQVVREWEAACEPARAAGIRVVNTRFGHVASSCGGLFPIVLKTVRYGLGARFGDGRQWWSWVAMPDLVRIIQHCLTQESLSGPVNAVSPEPLRNREMIALAGRLLRRPTPWALPAWLLHLVGGQTADELMLWGQRVAATRLGASGFEFHHPDAETMLRDVMAGEF